MHSSSIVHVVDDDDSFRRAVGGLLGASGYPVALYSSAREFLEKLSPASRGCVLLDVHMPGLSGPELQSRLNAAKVSMPIIFVSGHADIPITVQTIKAGAENFLCKPVLKDDLIRAVEDALANDAVRQRQREQDRALHALAATLTPREKEVFRLIARGRLNKQIAHDLGTSERTIKAHRHAVMEKLKARSLAELVLMAERLGSFRPAPD
jgi:RNA polymerase sigma factor (sigma-70 family)